MTENGARRDRGNGVAGKSLSAPTDNARERYYVCNGPLPGPWRPREHGGGAFMV